jgi:hypothetical protein
METCVECGITREDVRQHPDDADAVDFEFADLLLCRDCYADYCYDV